MNVLVTDGDTRAALAITRSLGRVHRVFAASSGLRSLASSSRYCAGPITYPDPACDAAGFLATIERETAAHEIDLLLPVTDISVLLLAQHRRVLPLCCRLPVAPFDVLMRAADKAEVAALATRVDVPLPATCILHSAAELGAVIDAVGCPLVVKPARSRVRIGDGWRSTHVTYAGDADELRVQVGALPAHFFPVLLQERISGPGTGVFLCYDEGRCVATFAHRRLREMPPSGGVSVLCESVAPDPDACTAARRLLDELGWHGVAMVEFKRDDRDGVAKLMEINGRFWGSLQLAIDAGVDFPALLAAVAQGRRPEPVPDYRVGARLRWTLGSVDALLSSLFSTRERRNLPARESRRAHAIARFLLSFHSGRSETLRTDDPGPGWYELRRWLQSRRNLIHPFAAAAADTTGSRHDPLAPR